MERQFIVDESGAIKGVIIDYSIYKQIEEILEDFYLGKIMENCSGEEEFDIEAVKKDIEYL